jgi:hypothetical protein
VTGYEDPGRVESADAARHELRRLRRSLETAKARSEVATVDYLERRIRRALRAARPVLLTEDAEGAVAPAVEAVEPLDPFDPAAASEPVSGATERLRGSRGTGRGRGPSTVDGVPW